MSVASGNRRERIVRARNRNRRTKQLVDLSAKRASRERQQAAEKILATANKIAKMVRSRKRCGADVLKILETVVKYDNFMQELVLMRLDSGKHHLSRHLSV